MSIYADPGVLVETAAGAPVAGAKVVLERANGPHGRFRVVPNRSQIMTPTNRRNPDRTNADGLAGWDLAPGYYRISASKPGCHAPGKRRRRTATTRVLIIPPLASNVVIRLDCPRLRRTPTHVDLLRLRTGRNLPVRLLAIVVGGRRRPGPTGTLTLRTRGRLLAVLALEPDGSASIGVSVARSRAITATYSGDGNFAPSRVRLR
jgi:hypothetical protein